MSPFSLFLPPTILPPPFFSVSPNLFTHSLQYVYSGSSGIPNLPEFMTVGLVDGEPITYYDSNIRREVPRQEWMAKAVDPDYWNRNTQVSMDTEVIGHLLGRKYIFKMLFNK
uniref:MHC class I-like antigen recognition-like domain-containing protein n=1 Tax=Paramormyrops kingsleyae TaxID=1676925 RepID=A0A3B3Q6I7_9TELE